MVYGLWHSAAGLQAQQYRQAVITNNLANSDTPGFKPDRVAFTDRLSAARNGGPLGASHSTLDPLTGGIFALPVYTDFSNGSFEPTNNPLDVAIDGGGFLTIQTADGLRYTRDGRMTHDTDGTLIHVASGGPVLDTAGNPIGLNPGTAKDVSIDRRGRIIQDGNEIAQLGIVDFDDRSKLQKEGTNLFSGDQARRIAAGGAVRQKMIENSLAEPTMTLVDMIAATRAYEINASMLAMQDDTLGRAVNELGRLG